MSGCQPLRDAMGMVRVLPLLLALLLPVPAVSGTVTPLCRVTASYRPVAWPSWATAEQRFRRITVALRSGCPAAGVAQVVLINAHSGRRLPERGFYALTPAHPVRVIPAAPPYAVTTPGWQVYWRAASGRLYEIPQTPSRLPGALP